MNNTPLLLCKKLSKHYQNTHNCVQVLKNINFNVYSGEMISIMGHSGSGKSTLLHLLGGLDEPSSGKIIFEGQILHKISQKQRATILNQRLGFIYQFHHLLSDFNVLENTAMPLMIYGHKTKDAQNTARDILKIVGLQHRENHKPYELSGGERQRAAIARALIHKPTLILGDEPTGNLDQKTANNIFQLLYEINKKYGTTLLIATHDTHLTKFFHRTLELSNGTLQHRILTNSNVTKIL